MTEAATLVAEHSYESSHQRLWLCLWLKKSIDPAAYTRDLELLPERLEPLQEPLEPRSRTGLPRRPEPSGHRSDRQA
jgi:hypothetical protein